MDGTILIGTMVGILGETQVGIHGELLDGILGETQVGIHGELLDGMWDGTLGMDGVQGTT